MKISYYNKPQRNIHQQLSYENIRVIENNHNWMINIGNSINVTSLILPDL